MQQKDIDNSAILALLLTCIADVIALFLEITNQEQQRKEDQEKTQSDKTTQDELTRLQNEINFLKLEIEQIKKLSTIK